MIKSIKHWQSRAKASKSERQRESDEEVGKKRIAKKSLTTLENEENFIKMEKQSKSKCTKMPIKRDFEVSNEMKNGLTFLNLPEHILCRVLSLNTDMVHKHKVLRLTNNRLYYLLQFSQSWSLHRQLEIDATEEYSKVHEGIKRLQFDMDPKCSEVTFHFGKMKWRTICHEPDSVTAKGCPFYCGLEFKAPFHIISMRMADYFMPIIGRNLTELFLILDANANSNEFWTLADAKLTHLRTLLIDDCQTTFTDDRLIGGLISSASHSLQSYFLITDRVQIGAVSRSALVNSPQLTKLDVNRISSRAQWLHLLDVLGEVLAAKRTFYNGLRQPFAINVKIMDEMNAFIEGGRVSHAGVDSKPSQQERALTESVFHLATQFKVVLDVNGRTNQRNRDLIHWIQLLMHEHLENGQFDYIGRSNVACIRAQEIFVWLQRCWSKLDLSRGKRDRVISVSLPWCFDSRGVNIVVLVQRAENRENPQFAFDAVCEPWLHSEQVLRTIESRVHSQNQTLIRYKFESLLSGNQMLVTFNRCKHMNTNYNHYNGNDSVVSEPSWSAAPSQMGVMKMLNLT